jgi:hypothetical protein
VRALEQNAETKSFLKASKLKGKEHTALILGMVVLAILVLGIVFMVVFK